MIQDVINSESNVNITESTNKNIFKIIKVVTTDPSHQTSQPVFTKRISWLQGFTVILETKVDQNLPVYIVQLIMSKSKITFYFTKAAS